MNRVLARSDNLTVNLSEEVSWISGHKIDWTIAPVRKTNSGGYPYEDMTITARITNQEKREVEGEFTLEVDPRDFTGLVKSLTDYFLFYGKEKELKDIIAEYDRVYVG